MPKKIMSRKQYKEIVEQTSEQRKTTFTADEMASIILYLLHKFIYKFDSGCDEAEITFTAINGQKFAIRVEELK